jgi:stearoyl-CoA desaturase (Delta-9 desaturase)
MLSAIVALFRTDWSWSYLPWIIALYFLKFFGFTGINHRYFSHRSYKTSRLFQVILALWANTTLMRGPLRFASGHRYHHRHSDTEKDLHSPIHGFLHCYLWWYLSEAYHEEKLRLIDDLKKYPELKFLNTVYFLPWIIHLLILYLIGGTGLMVWAGLLTTLLVWHVAFSNVYFFHAWGSQPYKTGDQSRNNPYLAIITMGESWHNNHHHNMHSANIGHNKNQIDLGYLFILLMEKIGLIWDVKKNRPAI